MSDSKYIQNLYTKTHTLIHKSNIKPGTKEYRLKVEPNIAALHTLASESDNDTFKHALIKSINNIHESNATFDINTIFIRNETVSSENKQRLENQMLSFSKQLKHRVGDFKESLENDENVLKNATMNMQANCESANAGIRRMGEMGADVKVWKMALYVFIIFIVMYFFIRFL